MQQDSFPGYAMIYRELCCEKVKFPQRDPNMRMLMEQFCKDSPMFDYVEQIANREAPKSKPSIPAPKEEFKVSDDAKHLDQDGFPFGEA